MKPPALIALTILSGCTYSTLGSEELRSRKPSEEFQLPGSVACVYEKATAYVATVVSGYDKDFRGHISADSRSAWLRHPLVLFDLEAQPQGGTRVRRYPVSPDVELGNGQHFSTWLRAVDCK